MYRKIIGLLCVLALLLSASASTVKVNANTKVYQSASKSSASISVKKGTKVTLVDTDDDWAQIERNGATGYIPVK